MRAEIIRVSELLKNSAVPPIAAEVVLRAEGLPPDAKVEHILPVGDYWEILLSSSSYEDKSIARLMSDPGLTLYFSPETIAELQASLVRKTDVSTWGLSEAVTVLPKSETNLAKTCGSYACEIETPHSHSGCHEQ